MLFSSNTLFVAWFIQINIKNEIFQIISVSRFLSRALRRIAKARHSASEGRGRSRSGVALFAEWAGTGAAKYCRTPSSLASSLPLFGCFRWWCGSCWSRFVFTSPGGGSPSCGDRDAVRWFPDSWPDLTRRFWPLAVPARFWGSSLVPRSRSASTKDWGGFIGFPSFYDRPTSTGFESPYWAGPPRLWSCSSFRWNWRRPFPTSTARHQSASTTTGPARRTWSSTLQSARPVCCTRCHRTPSSAASPWTTAQFPAAVFPEFPAVFLSRCSDSQTNSETRATVWPTRCCEWQSDSPSSHGIRDCKWPRYWPASIWVRSLLPATNRIGSN